MYDPKTYERKVETLKKLKNLLCYLEDEGTARRTFPTQQFLNITSENCQCRDEQTVKRPVKYVQVMTLDGEPAIPKEVYMDEPLNFHPPPQNLSPDMTPLMSCYKRTKTRHPSDCGVNCECSAAEGGHVHRPIGCVAPGKAFHAASLVKDHCTDPDFKPNCPPEDGMPAFVPNIYATCQYPESCKADCFDHADWRDMVNVRPTYKNFLQRRKYLPF